LGVVERAILLLLDRSLQKGTNKNKHQGTRSMSETPHESSRKIVLYFTLGGLGIFLLYALLFVFIALNGGVDVFIAVAPICVGSFLLLASIYVGVFMATYSKSKGNSPLLWGFLGLILTAGLIYGAQLLMPPLIIIAPILSSVITTFLIGVSRKESV
jgi:hypothetical protein